MGTGASAAQNQIGASQQGFMSTLQGDFGTSFAGQQNILNGLTKSLTTTLNAGPSQYGFSQPENTALNTLATTQNAQNYQNARAAAGAAGAAQGGGAILPSGSQGQTQAELASNAANAQSNTTLGIQEAGYRQGNANYNAAVSGLQGTAGLENPTGLAGQANTASGEAANTAATIQKENAAASPWAQASGLIGALGGAAISGLTGGLGGAAMGALGSLKSFASSTGASNAANMNGSEEGVDLGGISPQSTSNYNF